MCADYKFVCVIVQFRKSEISSKLREKKKCVSFVIFDMTTTRKIFFRGDMLKQAHIEHGSWLIHLLTDKQDECSI